ncbi:GrpB family protein [Glutamicibacter sp. AOP5-B1-3]|uniref:GrpB family protein n=1 Tax=Glutamicibacter sp. M10 TaxID=3023076 RepID=UPI001035611C|nr:hypothetical protein EYR88_12570 [Arthrobacter sp. S41]
MFGIPDIADASVHRSALEGLSPVVRHRQTDHRLFRPPAGKPRTVHVHVCETGSKWEQDHMAFRDRLRTEATLVIAT